MNEIVNKINILQQKIDKIIDLDEKGLLERRELDAFKSDTETEIRTFIDQVDDENQRMFKKITSGWKNMPKPGYTTPGEARKSLKDFIDLISSIVKAITGKDFEKDIYVPAGKVFDGRQYIQNIVSTAKKNIFIVDAYLSKDILPILAGKADTMPSFSIKFLVGDKNQKKFDGFSSDLPFFIKQYPLVNIECKVHDNLHDRFIIIDDEEIYTVGSSFDAVGEKGNSIIKITDVISSEKHKTDMSLLWNTGKNLADQ